MGHLFSLILHISLFSFTNSITVTVKNINELNSNIEKASPGDLILLANG
jgi:hypothetical protein